MSTPNLQEGGCYGPPLLQKLTMVQQKLEELFAEGKLVPGELDAICIQDLETLSQQQACMALDFLVNATKSTIHNKSAFLKGIIAKSRAKESQMKKCQYSSGGLSPIHPIVQAKLDTIFSTGLAKREEIDASIIDSLAQFDVLVACQIVDIFAQKDLSKIQSKSGFLAGIMKRFRERGAGYSPHLHNQSAMYFAGMGMPSYGHMPYGGGKGMGMPMYPTLSPTPRAYSKELTPVVQERLNLFYSTGLMKPTDLDPAILESLAQFPPENGLAILEKLQDADLANIRNKNGFLAGIMKRFRGGTRCVNPEDNLQAQALLPASVQVALEDLYGTGLVQRTELDGKVIAQLSDLDEEAALDAVARFRTSRLSHVTNRSGFLVGIIHKVKSERAAAQRPASAGSAEGRTSV